MKRNLKFSILAIITILMLIMPIVPVMATSVNTDVAKIGDKSYATLEEAIRNVPTDGTETTITLLRNVVDGTGFKVVSGQNIVIDFNNFSYDASNPLVGSTGTETNGCQLLKGSTVTFKNGTLVSDAAAILIQNYCNLTLKDMTVDTTSGSAAYTLSNNCGKVNIIGNTTIKGNAYAFDMCWAPNKKYPEGTQITVDTTGTIKGNIELGLWGTMSTGDINSTLTIKNINHEGNIVVSESALKDQLTIQGGTYSSDVTAYVADGLVCKKVGEKYVVNTEYNVTLPTGTVDGGTVTATPTKAFAGETIAIATTPNEGYVLKGLTVKDVAGNVITVTDGKFVMPASNVTVAVEFAKEYTVTLPTVDGGTVTSTTNKATAGETVTLVTTPKEGYEFKGVTVKDALGNIIEVKDGKFVMPNTAVTVEVNFAKLSQETEVPVIDPTEEVEEVTVGVADKDKVESVLLESLNANPELAELSKTSNIKVSVEVTNIELTEEEQKEIDQMLAESEEKISIAKFFDIEVLVKDKDTQAELGKLTELNEKIEFTIALPEDLKSVDEGYTRIFYIVRGHNDEFDALEATLSEDGKFLTFASDKFSIYALAYVDVKDEVKDDVTNNEENKNEGVKDETPKTGDIVLEVSAALAIISVAGIVVFAKRNKKSSK